MKLAAIALTLTLGTFPFCQPSVAKELTQTSEKPWVDLSGTLYSIDASKPVDMAELSKAMGSYSRAVTAASIKMAGLSNYTFDFIIFDPGNNHGSSYSKNYGNVQVAVLTGGARVQLGNHREVKTFQVDGDLSVCEVAPTYLQCYSMGKLNRVDTDSPKP
jgi:hypothetical protein